jgi:ElaB/YqjD/DUF883 family membrane-anchored ribosome-binding protein
VVFAIWKQKPVRFPNSDYGAPNMWVHLALPHIPDLRCHHACYIRNSREQHSSHRCPTQTESEVETRLTEEIQSLWAAHQEHKTASKQSKDQLRAVRDQLAEKLHAMKSPVVRTGRGSGWTAYLRSERLSRATADRYVSRHESLLNPPEKRLTEAISKPSEDDIRRLVRSLLPRLRRVLTTREWID